MPDLDNARGGLLGEASAERRNIERKGALSALASLRYLFRNEDEQSRLQRT